MSLVSTGFLLFLFAGIIIYYLIPKKMQWVWLLLMSYAYYLCSGYKTVIFIISTTVITFIAARLLDRESDELKRKLAEADKENKKILKETAKARKKRIVVFLLLLDFGILAAVKYFSFAIENVNAILKLFNGGEETFSVFTILLPLGISFYTFQSVSYVIDIYREKYRACDNIFKFALFVSYFPQIMQGPIGRYDRLAPQFEKPHFYKLETIQFGLQRVLYGFFKKMVIADRAGVVSDMVFNNPYDYNGLYVILGVLMYCLQLYADFSGGMDVVIGVSQMLDIKMDENFRQPFFSRSIGEFWRRWHITLGAWMKDYVFYPFSLSKPMNKLGKFLKKHTNRYLATAIPICLADLLIFFIVGVWHGAAWKFIVYGMYNGMLIALSSILAPVYDRLFKVTHINKNASWYKCFQIARTFLLVNIGWYFDNAGCLKEAFVLMGNTVKGLSLTPLMDGSLTAMIGTGMDVLGLFVGVVTLFVIGVLKENGINIREAISAKPLVIRWLLYVMLVMSLPVLGYVSQGSGGFMYANF